jgi:mono/diheme cytochrome c family protein
MFVGFFGVLISSCQDAEKLKTDQYYAEGYALYTTHCANCHQENGKGMANLYPPLQGSEYLDNKELFICITSNGLSGEIEVAGKKYNRPMPANPSLKDIEIAEIVTYVYTTWGKETLYTPTDSVHQILTRCNTIAR